jgi:DIM1 family U5 snRNP protein
MWMKLLSLKKTVVVIRFGHDWDTQCMKMDETLYGVAEKVQNFAVIYLVDITQVPDFNKVRDMIFKCSMTDKKTDV